MNYIKKGKVNKPSYANPEVIKKLAKVSSLAKQLHDELTDQSIGEALGITKQSVNYHVKKAEGKI